MYYHTYLQLLLSLQFPILSALEPRPSSSYRDRQVDVAYETGLSNMHFQSGKSVILFQDIH